MVRREGRGTASRERVVLIIVEEVLLMIEGSEIH